MTCSGGPSPAPKTDKITPERAILQAIAAPVRKVKPAEIDPGALGLGALGIQGIMTMAEHANRMQTKKLKVTGASLFDFFKTVRGTTVWPNQAALECGSVPAYPAVCAFSFPVAEYTKDGNVTIPGLESVDVKPYLP